MKKITLAIFLLLGLQGFAQFPAPYCGTTFTSGVEPITLVNFAGINNTTDNTTGGVAHEDYTSLTANVNFGSTYPITLKGNTDGAYLDKFSVFIDWNKNNIFTDAGETYDIGGITGSTGIDATVLVGNIEVPATASLGTTRIRVVKFYNAFPTSCQTGAGFGEAEDYSITVTAPSCLSPTAGTSTVNTTTLVASLSWTAGGNASNFIVVQTAGTGIPAVAAGTGVAVTGTTYTTSPLSASTSYEYYVRSECVAGTTYSSWAGPYLFDTNTAPDCAILTTPADAAIDVVVNLINSTTTPSTRSTAVALAWNAPATPVAGYRIYFGQVLATLPVLNATGTPFAGTGVNITGILYNTTYYWKAVPEDASGVQAENCPVFSFTTGTSPGYCLNGVLSPAATYTPATCNGTTVNTITPVAIRAGRYSNVNLTSGQTYKFNSSVATDFITLSTDAGLTAVASGPAPLTWTSNFTGTTRVYVHLTDQCEASATTSTRTSTVICGAALLQTASFDVNRFNAYPNPANDVLYLSNDKNITNVTVYNLLGVQVITKTLNDSKYKLDITSLSTGSYLVKVTSNETVNTVNTVKLVKE